MLNDNGGVVREAFKKKTQKSLEIFQTGGGEGPSQIQTFFWILKASLIDDSEDNEKEDSCGNSSCEFSFWFEDVYYRYG